MQRLMRSEWVRHHRRRTTDHQRTIHSTGSHFAPLTPKHLLINAAAIFWL